jgi:hypothetical protein
VAPTAAGGGGGVAGGGGAGGSAGADPAWGCVGEGRAAGGGGAPGDPIRVVFRAFGAARTIPLDGARVQLCAKVEVDVDADCGALEIAPQQTDATGVATFAGVPRGFDGYFKVTRADVRTVLYFPGLLSRDVEELTPVGSLTVEAYEGIVRLLTGSEGPERPGAALLYVKDCGGALAPGVRFSVRGREDALPFYVSGTVPVVTESQTTDETPGQGGFLNLPEDAFVTFEAEHVETGTRLPAASAFIKPGALTVVAMGPPP